MTVISKLQQYNYTKEHIKQVKNMYYLTAQVVDNYDEIRANSIKGSGNRNIGREGIIKILKWLS